MVGWTAPFRGGGRARAQGPKARQLVFRAAAVAAMVAAALVVPAESSRGDRDRRFRACASACLHLDCVRAEPDRPPREWHLRALGWTCPQECRYRCMRENHAERVAGGEAVVQYRGKWPFLRVLGVQELFSSLFSALNGLPHAQYFWRLGRVRASPRYPYMWLWRAHAAMMCNVWLWSTVFHARDTPLTERLDYFCASAGVMLALYATLVRVLEVRRRRAQALVLAAFAAFWAAHNGWMLAFGMNYGWNMTVSLAAGGSYAALWAWWAWDNSHLPHARMIGECAAMLAAFAMFEVFDFPPLADLLDAHAVWHGLTPLVAYRFYRFVVEDAVHYGESAGKAG